MSRKIPPRTDLPRLPRHKARRLAEADARSAAGYDALEEAADRVDRFVRGIQQGALVVELPDDEPTDGRK